MKLIKQNDTVGALPKDFYRFEDGVSITEAIMEIFPDGFDHDEVSITLNGKLLRLPKFDEHGNILCDGDHHDLTRPLGDKDKVGVLMETKGALGVILAIISIASAVYAYISIPDVPDVSVDSTGESTVSNNQLYGQKNSAKVYDAIPDIYGQQIAYPDLITSEPWKQYKKIAEFENQTEIIQFMCLGIGYFDLQDEIKLGGTPLSQIPNSSYEIFEPRTVDGYANPMTSVSDFKSMFSVEQVEGQTLRDYRTDESTTLEDCVVFISNENIANPVGKYTVGFGLGPNNDNEDYDTSFFEVGKRYYLTSFSIINSDDEVDYLDSLIEVTEIKSDNSGEIFFEVIEDIEDAFQTAFDNGDFGNYAIYILRKDGTDIEGGAFAVGYDETLNLIGPYDTTVSGEGFVIDLIYPRGFKDSTATYELTYVEIDKPGGVEIGAPVVETIEDSPRGATGYTQQSRSFFYRVIPINEVSKDNYKYFRVSLKRTTLISGESSAPSESKFESLKSFRDYSYLNNPFLGTGLHLENVSILKVSIPGTPGSVSPRRNKVNVDLVRKTISYNTETGEVDYELRPSKRFADAILHEFVMVFKQDPSLLDLDELYSIQESLDEFNYNLGEFCYTLQDKAIGLEARIQLICNSVRVKTYRDGKLWRFVRTELKEFENGIITSRDIASERSFAKNWTSRLPSEYDSIRLEFVDPDLNKKSYIYRRIASNGVVENEPGINEKKITLTGCRNSVQANNRIDFEIRKMLYSSFTVSETLLSQGSIYDIGDLVLYGDVYSKAIYGGEIKEIVDSNVLLLSERVPLDLSIDYEIKFNNPYGEVIGPFAIDVLLSDSSNKKVHVIDPDFSEIYTSDFTENQLGSRFAIIKKEKKSMSKYIIEDKVPRSDSNSIDVTMTQYNDKMFDMDKYYDINGVPGESRDPLDELLPGTDIVWEPVQRGAGAPSNEWSQFVGSDISFDSQVIDLFMLSGAHSRSVDGGDTFNYVGNICDAARDAETFSIVLLGAAVARNTGVNGIIYASVKLSNSGGVQVHKIMKSMDGGVNWFEYSVFPGLNIPGFENHKIGCSKDGGSVLLMFASSSTGYQDISGYKVNESGTFPIGKPSIIWFVEEPNPDYDPEDEESTEPETIFVLHTQKINSFTSMAMRDNGNAYVTYYEAFAGGCYSFELNGTNFSIMRNTDVPQPDPYDERTFVNIGILSGQEMAIQHCSGDGKFILAVSGVRNNDNDSIAHSQDGGLTWTIARSTGIDINDGGSVSQRKYPSLISPLGTMRFAAGANAASAVNTCASLSEGDDNGFDYQVDGLNSGTELLTSSSPSIVETAYTNGRVWIAGLSKGSLDGYIAIAKPPEEDV